jgi:ribose transport system permease protein
MTSSQPAPASTPPTSTPPTTPPTAIWERFRQAGILILLVLCYIIFALTVPTFSSLDNLINGIALSAAINTIVAVGMTFVIISSGIDLSVGSIAALCAVIGADLIVNRGVPLLPAAIATLGIGGLAGAINGLLVARLRLASFVVTLGTMSFYRGLALTYTNGQPILNVPDNARDFFGGQLGILPVPVLIGVLVVLAGIAVLNYTKLGAYVTAIGGNEEAARLTGIPVVNYVTLTYIISGMLSALAALVLFAQLGAAEPIAGSGWELSAIAAAVVGGTRLSGGKGTIAGTLLGAVLLAMLQNVLTLLNVQSFYQLLVTGAIIIGAILVDRLLARPN